MRMSIKRIAMSMKSTSGCSYITHMILPASIAEPPPSAMMQSGWKAAIALAPSLAQARVGIGSNVVEAGVLDAHLVQFFRQLV